MFSVSVSLLGTEIPVDDVPSDEANVAHLPILVTEFPFGSVIDDTVNVTGPVNAPIGETAMMDDVPLSPADTPKLFDRAATVTLPVLEDRLHIARRRVAVGVDFL
jgi:hypothetical protein